MKKTHETLPPEQTVATLSHFAWCALVALRIAQKDGQALSPLSMHAFLLRWLTVAYKQKRFPRAIASDIEGLLTLGRNRGLAAGLLHRLEYLWMSCSGPVSAQSDLYRLTYTIESLKSQGWINAVVADEEWGPDELLAEYAGTQALLVRKSELVKNYSEQGILQHPVSFLIAGDVSVVIAAMEARALQYALHEESAEGGRLSLLPLN
ncbi:DUF2913 family protein [Serratia marcescens]